MAIWAIKRPDKEKNLKYVAESLTKDGISRFGWSYQKNFDLKILSNKKWDELTENEKESWKKSHFLLNIKKGDWIVHVNVPSYGKCLAGIVKNEYTFESDVPSDIDDFRHCIQLKDVISFDRNDPKIHPSVSARLKLRGAHWQISPDEEERFNQSIDAIKKDNKIDIFNGVNYYYLNKELQDNDFYNKLIKAVHDSHPGKSFEKFLAELFVNGLK